MKQETKIVLSFLGLVLVLGLVIQTKNIVFKLWQSLFEPPHIIIKIPVHESTNGGFIENIGECYSIPEEYNYCGNGGWKESKSDSLARVNLGDPIIIDTSILKEYNGEVYEAWFEGVKAKNIQNLLFNTELVKVECKEHSNEIKYRCFRWWRAPVKMSHVDAFNCWYTDGAVECQEFNLNLPKNIIPLLEQGELKVYSITNDRDKTYNYVDGYLEIGNLVMKIEVECTENGHCPKAAPYCNLETYECVECLKDEHCEEGYECVDYECVPIEVTTTTIPIIECSENKDCFDYYKSCDYVCINKICEYFPIVETKKVCPDGTEVSWLDYPDCKFEECPTPHEGFPYWIIIIPLVIVLLILVIWRVRLWLF